MKVGLISRPGGCEKGVTCHLKTPLPWLPLIKLHVQDGDVLIYEELLVRAQQSHEAENIAKSGKPAETGWHDPVKKRAARSSAAKHLHPQLLRSKMRAMGGTLKPRAYSLAPRLLQRLAGSNLVTCTETKHLLSNSEIDDAPQKAAPNAARLGAGSSIVEKIDVASGATKLEVATASEDACSAGAQKIEVSICEHRSGRHVATLDISETATVGTVIEQLPGGGDHIETRLLLGVSEVSSDTVLSDLFWIMGGHKLEFEMKRTERVTPAPVKTKKPRAAKSPRSDQGLAVGSRVQLMQCCGRSGLGRVAHVGPVAGLHGGQQVCLGLKMDEPLGRGCDGQFNGSRYFTCKRDYALFVLPEEVRSIQDGTALLKKERVTYRGTAGTICFRGPTKFASGEWLGIALDTAVGKNDGCVRGVQYFWCAPQHGVFVRPGDVHHME